MLLQGNHADVVFFKASDDRVYVVHLLPHHGVFRTKCDFRYIRPFSAKPVNRGRGTAAQVDLCDAGAVGGAQYGADIVGATDVVRYECERMRHLGILPA